MALEWIVVVLVAFCIDKAKSSHCLSPKLLTKPVCPVEESKGLKASIEIEKPDVAQERQNVEQLLQKPIQSHAIVCDNLKKVYPGIDGSPNEFAVRGLSLALPHGECFCMLGPNGVGKSTFINMMIGLTKPSSGMAYIEGLNIWTQMAGIYTTIGVCPQTDLLWDILTGREHLKFYGRLKNLKGHALIKAVEESLKGANLLRGGVADRQVKTYSGGMKRRLSVAISLIGDPKVVFMDEPSTGLDPASRSDLWNVIRNAKRDKAILLTTHDMEEAEQLCDRLAIMVDGSLHCIGDPNELKWRFGQSYKFTMTTSQVYEEAVESLAMHLSPNAKKIHNASGTQMFELPKSEVTIGDVFEAVGKAKKLFEVQSWGVADTKLEDVFIEVVQEAQQLHNVM